MSDCVHVVSRATGICTHCGAQVLNLRPLNPVRRHEIASEQTDEMMTEALVGALIQSLREADDYAQFTDLKCQPVAADIRELLDAAEHLLGKYHKLQRSCEALEQLRPVWAQGYTEDSVAAQATAAALSFFWKQLGAENQTQAVQKFIEIMEARSK